MAFPLDILKIIFEYIDYDTERAKSTCSFWYNNITTKYYKLSPTKNKYLNKPEIEYLHIDAKNIGEERGTPKWDIYITESNLKYLFSNSKRWPPKPGLNRMINLEELHLPDKPCAVKWIDTIPKMKKLKKLTLQIPTSNMTLPKIATLTSLHLIITGDRDFKFHIPFHDLYPNLEELIIDGIIDIMSNNIKDDIFECLHLKRLKASFHNASYHRIYTLENVHIREAPYSDIITYRNIPYTKIYNYHNKSTPVFDRVIMATDVQKIINDAIFRED